MHPVPAFNPNDGPIGTDSHLSFWLGGLLMAMPLAGFTAALAATGSRYLYNLRSGRRIRAAWASSVTAALAVEVIFVGIFIAPQPVLGMELGHVNWGLTVLSASFAAVGGTMGTIIAAAARTARRQASATRRHQRTPPVEPVG